MNITIILPAVQVVKRTPEPDSPQPTTTPFPPVSITPSGAHYNGETPVDFHNHIRYQDVCCDCGLTQSRVDIAARQAGYEYDNDFESPCPSPEKATMAIENSESLSERSLEKESSKNLEKGFEDPEMPLSITNELSEQEDDSSRNSSRGQAVTESASSADTVRTAIRMNHNHDHVNDNNGERSGAETVTLAVGGGESQDMDIHSEESSNISKETEVNETETENQNTETKSSNTAVEREADVEETLTASIEEISNEIASTTIKEATSTVKEIEKSTATTITDESTSILETEESSIVEDIETEIIQRANDGEEPQSNFGESAVEESASKEDNLQEDNLNEESDLKSLKDSCDTQVVQVNAKESNQKDQKDINDKNGNDKDDNEDSESPQPNSVQAENAIPLVANKDFEDIKDKVKVETDPEKPLPPTEDVIVSTTPTEERKSPTSTPPQQILLKSDEQLPFESEPESPAHVDGVTPTEIFPSEKIPETEASKPQIAKEKPTSPEITPKAKQTKNKTPSPKNNSNTSIKIADEGLGLVKAVGVGATLPPNSKSVSDKSKTASPPKSKSPKQQQQVAIAEQTTERDSNPNPNPAKAKKSKAPRKPTVYPHRMTKTTIARQALAREKRRVYVEERIQSYMRNSQMTSTHFKSEKFHSSDSLSQISQMSQSQNQTQFRTRRVKAAEAETFPQVPGPNPSTSGGGNIPVRFTKLGDMYNQSLPDIANFESYNYNHSHTYGNPSPNPNHIPFSYHTDLPPAPKTLSAITIIKPPPPYNHSPYTHSPSGSGRANESKSNASSDNSAEMNSSVSFQSETSQNSGIYVDSDPESTSNFWKNVSEQGFYYSFRVRQSGTVQMIDKSVQTGEQPQSYILDFSRKPDGSYYERSSRPFHLSSSDMHLPPINRDKILRDISETVQLRHDAEVRRAELIQRANDLQTMVKEKREKINRRHEFWHKKYIEESSMTRPMEAGCNSLRAELNTVHRRLIAHLEGRDLPLRLRDGPSKKANYKIMAARLQHEIKELQQKAKSAKLRLESEIKLKEQAEREVRDIRNDLAHKKVVMSLARSQLGTFPSTHPRAYEALVY